MLDFLGGNCNGMTSDVVSKLLSSLVLAMTNTFASVIIRRWNENFWDINFSTHTRHTKLFLHWNHLKISYDIPSDYSSKTTNQLKYTHIIHYRRMQLTDMNVTCLTETDIYFFVSEYECYNTSFHWISMDTKSRQKYERVNVYGPRGLFFTMTQITLSSCPPWVHRAGPYQIWLFWMIFFWHKSTNQKTQILIWRG